MNSDLIFKRAGKDDFKLIWPIFKEVIQAGDTYAFEPDTPYKKAEAYWINEKTHTYIVELNKQIVGTFILRDNQMGLGNHIANAGYMVASEARNKGIGRQMAEFSFSEAKRLGYTAMQYNFVVSTNVSAVELWRKLGFSIIGKIPNGYRHSELGLVDCYIMHKELT